MKEFQHILLLPRRHAATGALVASFTLVLTVTVQAASFDCAKAHSKVEHLVCENPELSELDSNLTKEYQTILSKANEEEKQRLPTEQRHWLSHTRNACEDETCLKHAYWSRQAALETYFEPHPPLLKKESDKAEAIKKVLATAPLYQSKGTVDAINQFCGQIFDDLKQMKGIRLVEPVVQVQSYQDPALDSWKRQCQSAPPFHVSYECRANAEPGDADRVVNACYASYGLPPFKLYELPVVGTTGGGKRYIFYSHNAYGPMNIAYRKPMVGGGFPGFQEIDITRCLSALGNRWEHGKKTKSSWDGVAVVAQRDRHGKSFDSVLEYKNDYYLMLLNEQFGGYWLTIQPIESEIACRWSPVQIRR